MSGSEERELPEGWVETTVEAIVSVEDARRVPLNATERSKRAGSYPYYGANGQVGTIDDYLFEGSHILVAEDGGYFFDPHKGVAYIASGKFWVNNHAHVLQAMGGIPPEYIKHALNQVKWNDYVSGTTRPKLTQAALRRVLVHIPPLNEQKRIVARIDALTEKSREAREALEEVPVLLDKLRQSILASAFRGDLTREWRAKNPDVEPASVLLERIRQERRKKWEEAQLAKFKAKGKLPQDDSWKKKYVEPQPVDTTDLPDLPEGWCWASLDEIANIETGSTPPGKVAGTYGGTVPFVKPTDLSAGFRVTSARQTLSDLGLAHVTAVRAGSTLLTCIGATIGKAGLARTTCAFNQQINAATSFFGIDDEYLYWALIGPATQAWIVTNASATTLPILNKGRLAKLPVPLCSLKEQKAIATILASTHPSAERLTQEHTSLANTLLHLDSAILAKAFRGELVPQDPNDEPASVLLERIAAERAAAESSGRKPRSKRAK